MTVLLTLATATLVVGCGAHGDRDRVQFGPDAGGFQVLAGPGALPEGHPPIGRQFQALPDGHPPLAGQGLPPGHPVCPAGRQMLERGMDGGTAGTDDGPGIISI